MSVFRVLDDAQVVAVVDNQWGDTGKGKYVDLLGEWADVIARGTGGANAGHTIFKNGQPIGLHLIPSGILHIRKVNVIGSGVAFDPAIAIGELETLAQAGISADNLRLMDKAILVLPQHILLDHLRDGVGGTKDIGTTRRGIGPAYRDHYDRIGLTVGDLINRDLFVRKLRRNLRDKVAWLKQCNPSDVTAAIDRLSDCYLFDVALERGQLFNETALVDQYMGYGQRLKQYLCNIDYVQKQFKNGKKILLEGAQGLLLSIHHGTYPYVTSSDCSVQGLAGGLGLRERVIDLTLGVTKAPYMTRVGKGPFPTEIGGEEAAAWCDSEKNTRDKEASEFPDVSVNGPDSLRRSIAIRQAGGEYGTTTGRPRRVGWLDLPLLRYATRYNGRDIALSKVDVLSQCKRIRACTSYSLDQRLCEEHGPVLLEANPDVNFLEGCTPVLSELPGWCCDVSHCRTFDELPPQLRTYVAFIEERADVRVRLISVGPERDQVVVR